MFYTVQTQLHTTNQKLEGNVWEICVKSLLFLKLNLQCFSAYLDLRNVWYCAFVVARYDKTKKFQNWKKNI